MQNVVGQPPQPSQPVQVPNYSGVNIQIFNPAVNVPGNSSQPPTITAPTFNNTPTYPQNYYTQNFGQPPSVVKPEEKKDEKTEKREIVQLTDDYIKTVENYLNSKDINLRFMGAQEVSARAQEDPLRKDDPALNALLNKMLQDPSQKIRVTGLALLDSRALMGNDFTVQILKHMQAQKSNYGQDAESASQILLKMSGTPIEKEFVVKDKPKSSKK